jgi:hypothetical protein
MKLQHLLSIPDALLIDQLTAAQFTELQEALSLLGYPLGETDVFQGNPNLIGKGSVQALQEKLSKLSTGQDGPLSQDPSKQDVIAAIKKECENQGIGLDTQIAYVLATTQWETAQTFKPAREAF